MSFDSCHNVSKKQINVEKINEGMTVNMVGILQRFKDCSLKSLCLQLPLRLECFLGLRNIQQLKNFSDIQNFTCDITRNECVEEVTISMRK